MAKLTLTSEEEILYLNLLDKVKEILPELKLEIIPDPSHLTAMRGLVRKSIHPIVRTRAAMLCEVSPL